MNVTLVMLDIIYTTTNVLLNAQILIMETTEFVILATMLVHHVMDQLLKNVILVTMDTSLKELNVLSLAQMVTTETLKPTNVTFVIKLVPLAQEDHLKNVLAATNYIILTDNVSIIAQLDTSETVKHGIVIFVELTALLVIVVEPPKNNVALVMKEDTYTEMNVSLSAQMLIMKNQTPTLVKLVTKLAQLAKTPMNVHLAQMDYIYLEHHVLKYAQMVCMKMIQQTNAKHVTQLVTLVKDQMPLNVTAVLITYGYTNHQLVNVLLNAQKCGTDPQNVDVVSFV
jgi:hypothetical protein